jgi:FAD/FMN-containing dehydrogenase
VANRYSQMPNCCKFDHYQNPHGPPRTNFFKCNALKDQFPSQVSFLDEKLYRTTLSKYWSLQQSHTLPACIFFPQHAQDVASVLRLSVRTRCPFAAKSGGHVPFAGASNIAGGITIDLTGLREITINTEKATVSVGAGNKWGEVYRKLEKLDITVVGGRIADVGVGGLTLGGGISFFSNMHGWACDNIATYELVTATGDIINVTTTSHPDLYWALRGGASNFGLVTKFEIYSYPRDRGLMWVGKALHPLVMSPSLIEAFVDFGVMDNDANATVLFSFVYLQKQEQYIIVSETDYATSVPDGAHPPVFDEFFNVGNAIQATKATKTVVEVIEEHSASNPNGLCQSYWTATFQLNGRLMLELVEIWKQEVEHIKERVTGFVPVLTFQVITVRMMHHMTIHGGNALGLDEEDGPLMIVAPSAMWTDSVHNDMVLSAYAKWLSRSNARARELGLHHRYLYMNYASQFQNPIEGYGEHNVERLRRIAKHYDPERVFQSLQPGYFKLG